ncbi:NADH-quinone oxidoreductase subunit NuoF [Clostridium sp. 'deep sea']|uniref:NADH-quinone oxidoreductase subunit NuoF n=1 Tax=Clostridium sp. 'deep sea' TaxID=2779445 RepID=UPI0018969E30|nr:NADH-quinone oxidoreductase subunit NuoF [Clostridium sp. 'deep sea']QOR36364.1 NADH-quinone oxidoreductase subunit NuoF [Clostridium sp. 'deep sea']
MQLYRAHVLVCGGTGCVTSGCQDVKAELEKQIDNYDLANEINVIVTGCVGTCDIGPIIMVYPEAIFYQKVQVEDVAEIVEEHLLKGRPVNRLMYQDKTSEIANFIEKYYDIEFFNRQTRVVLRNTGIIDPTIIDEYIARDGYQAAAKALTEMKAIDVVEEVKKSGLRGRGGGGFPTGLKLELGHKSPGDEKYMICNADEGDPGAFMDRSLLEGDPHAVIEGMILAGYAIGASQGYVYVRAEYPLAVERLTHAIKQAKEYGLLGKDIFGSGFDFELDLRVGAGAFVCGEETALMHSIEGLRGEPTPKPPFPTDAGVFGKPTAINNVESIANLPQIVLKGSDWFNKFGVEKNKGTKVFAVAGNIVNTGLVEVELGTTLRTVIFDICGGVPNGKKFKAVQIGGPAGGCIPAEYLDTPITYDSLISLGAMMGSGGLIVMDEDTCMVDLARFFLDFTQEESCGKCTPCRIGTKRMLEILERITEGHGQPGDIEKLEELALAIKDSAFCGLGKAAPNPVLSTLRFFRDEYENHIYNKKCTAGICKGLLNVEIDQDKCRSCGICARICPVNAITGERGVPYSVDNEKCTRCGLCIESCPFDAISKH